MAATDRNLLFGVLALQLDLLDAAQFVEACAAWAARKDAALADILLERGWLTPGDRADVERLLERKLKRNKGEINASLADTVRHDAERLLNVLSDPSINATISALTASDEASEPSVVPLPSQRRDQYTLLRLHAMGGIGQVWLARDATLGREVALKELRPDRAGDPALAARFLTEGQVTGQLEHPGVVPVYALTGPDAAQSPYYTMRFIKGRTLSDAVRTYHQQRAAGQPSPLGLRDLLTDFVAVCNTLAYAHSRGVIHRDLKGANIILGDYGEVMVVDWGLAKVLGRAEEKTAAPVALPAGSSDQTLPGHIIGTPAYMSPEQAAGNADAIGPASDVYGLGAILYEILTGRAPFDGSDTYEVLRKVMQEAPVPPRRLSDSVPPALEAICLRALSKKPDDRYPSASELARDVQRWLADEPVTAYPDPLLTRIGRAARRHRLLVTAAAALLVTAVIALSISTVLIGREKAKTDVARAETVQNFRRARDVVNRFNVQMSRERLLNEPGLQPLRESLAKQAVDEFRRFVEEDGDDPDVQADYGKALMTWANVTNEIGSKKRAIEIINEAIALFEKLAREHPETRSYLTDQARCHLMQGAFYHSARELANAERAWLISRRLYQQESPTSKPDLEDRKSLALVANNLGQLYTGQGKFPQTEDNIRTAFDIRHELAAADPKNEDYQRTLADTYGSRAALYFRTGHPREAEKDLEADRLIRLALCDAHPDNVEYKNDLATSYDNRGILYRRMGLRDQAVQAFEDALKVRSQVVERNPAVTQFRSELANVYRNLGSVNYDDLREANAAEHQWALLRALTGSSLDLGGAIAAVAKEQALRAGRDNYGKALEISRGLAKEYPQVLEFRAAVGIDCSNLGTFYYEVNKADALPWYSEAIELLEGVPNKELSLDIRHTLGNSYWGRAVIRSAGGAPLLALDDWNQALKIYRGPARDDLREEAQTHAKKLTSLPAPVVSFPTAVGLMESPYTPLPATVMSGLALERFRTSLINGDLAYRLGTLYALLSVGVSPDEEAKAQAQAIEMLRFAQGHGYFKEPARREQLHNDPDLDALRGRKDFRDLLAAVEK